MADTDEIPPFGMQSSGQDTCSDDYPTTFTNIRQKEASFSGQTGANNESTTPSHPNSLLWKLVRIHIYILTKKCPDHADRHKKSRLYVGFTNITPFL